MPTFTAKNSWGVRAVGLLVLTWCCSPFGWTQETTVVFKNLPFPDGLNVTDEFVGDGVVFTADDSGLPPNFPCISLGAQENQVFAGSLFNMFLITFVTPNPVTSVACEFVDQDALPQTHTLYALNDAGIPQKTISYDDAAGQRFTLEVVAPDGIAGLLMCEQPFGLQQLVSLRYTTVGSPLFLRGDADGDGTFEGLADSLFILAVQFIAGSPEPPCWEAADVDDSGDFNGLVDGLYALNFRFVTGSSPIPAPFPACGVDPALNLGCAIPPVCP